MTFHLLLYASFSLKKTYNQVHNILRSFDGSARFLVRNWHIGVADRVAE